MTKQRSRINVANFPDIIVGHAMDSSNVVKDLSSLNIDLFLNKSMGVKSGQNNLKHGSIHNGRS